MIKEYYPAYLPLFPSRQKHLIPVKISSPLSWILFAITLCLLASCGNSSSSTANAATLPAGAASYSVLTVLPRTTVINSDFPATIQGQQNVEIRPQIDGYLKAMYVDEGAVVKKGQLLFRISAPIYEQEVRTAEASIKIALANLNAAQMQVNQVTPLVEKNIISNYTLEAAQYTLQSQQAALAQAKATLINAQTNLGYATIYSPADGVIGVIPFKIGSLVSSTTTLPLTTVSNIQNVYAYFSINEKQQLNFFTTTKGKTLKEKLATLPPVTLILANGTDFGLKGRIESIGGLVDVTTGSVSFRATFQNPGNFIRSGSSATVRIPETIDTALLVPQSSTYQIQGKLFVYVAAPDNTIHSTAIQVNANTAGNSYVVIQGIRPGDKIVVDGIGNLREGLKIKPRIENADSVYARL